MTLLHILKYIPVDLGQGALRYRTKGKKIALALVPDGRGRTALDVGCREGVQTRWLREKGYSVTSIDIKKSYVHAELVDVNKPLPYAKEQFDLIWCSEVIEHLEDPAASLSEFRRVLKPNGTLILTTPNSDAWFFRIAAAFGLSPRKLQNPTHHHFFTLKSIRKLCPSATIYGYFPYTIVKCTIRRGLGLLTPTFIVEEKKCSLHLPS